MNIFEDEQIRIEFKDDIIFSDLVQKNTVITIGLAKKMVENRIKLTQGKPHLVCFRANKFSYADKSVRDFMKTEGTRNITAGAFIVNNPVTSVFFNFFIMITGVDKETPTKCFTKEEEAVNWLEKYRRIAPDEDSIILTEN